MYWNTDVTPEDEEKMITKIAETIHQKGLDEAAILTMDIVKPLSFIGVQMGRFFISPFLPLFGKNIGINGEKFFKTFEKRDNIEKLIKAVEKLTQEEEEQKKVEKARKLKEKKKKMGESEAPERKRWWQILPF